jgi:hypothetical protein
MARLVALIFILFISQVHAEPFSGHFYTYEDGESIKLSLTEQSNGSYQGQIDMEGEQYTFFAQKMGQKLFGSINEDGESYGFIATQKGQQLVLSFEDGEVVTFNPSHSSGTTKKPQHDAAWDSAYTEAVSTPRQSETTDRKVYINGKVLGTQQLQQLESAYQTTMIDGRYWYDKKCGAWGMENGPTAGFIMAGLDLPGPMSANASGGGTGIYINGREIHPLDKQGLQQLFGVTYKGRYWLDDQGNLGIENGAFIVNIVSAIQQAQSQQSGGSVTHGYGSGYGSRGTLGGGMYSGRTASGKSVFWYPGM